MFVKPKIILFKLIMRMNQLEVYRVLSENYCNFLYIQKAPC